MTQDIKFSPQLFDFIKELTGGDKNLAINTLNKLADIIRQFRQENTELLNKRNIMQQKIDSFFLETTKQPPSNAQVLQMLEEIGFIKHTQHQKIDITKADLPQEITPMAGPQLVVPADKVHMVLGAANARWGSLYNALYSSNIIDQTITDANARHQLVTAYVTDFLDKIVPFANGASWHDAKNFTVTMPKNGAGDKISLHITDSNKQPLILTDNSTQKLLGVNVDSSGNLQDLLIKNNGLKIEVRLSNANIEDIFIESSLTYIIDLEDASISAPSNKYESYRIIKGIVDGTLACEVRGQMRKIAQDTTYIDINTGQIKTLKRTALPLVRDVGPHMVADEEIMTVDGSAVPEKILDCFITSLIGMRLHVSPKMHGADEIAFHVRLFAAINHAQNLPNNCNKIGIMNEEMRTSAQLSACIEVAKNVIFFTNTGFLDYTGSFIDLMMHQGPIAPYRLLAQQTYKTEYEKHNVNISLAWGVPQIGAGMWAAIKDMAGLLKSKEAQVKGLTDTGWSPSPIASSLHAISFHIFGDVRQMQSEYVKNIRHVNIADLFAFPAANLASLENAEILRNIDFAIHGLLAYGEPWVRRGIGCSGVQDLSGEPLMEDRATARIKAAFVRNWLLHKVISKEQIEDSIKRMAKLIDEQNADVTDYTPLSNNNDTVVRAVSEVIFNPQNRRDSYVEPYFYPAYKALHH